MTVVHDITTKYCANCGKEISIIHPELWVYKKICGKKTTYWCSWSCLREAEKDECDMKKLTPEDKKEAIRIALNGGNPLEYIRMCGISNAKEAWRKIKVTLKEKNPAVWEKLPARVPTDKSFAIEIPEQAPTPNVSGPFIIHAEDVGAVEVETPEKPKKPEHLPVCAVRSLVLKDGFYRKNTIGTSMILGGLSMADDHLALTGEDWVRLSKEIMIAVKQLGVEV